jgi:hypothetical protein
VHHALAHSYGDSVTITAVHQSVGYSETNGIRGRKGSGRESEPQADAVADCDRRGSRLTIPDRNL